MFPIKNLKTARINKGLTQEELGIKVNVQKSAISKYERGDIQPSQEVLVKMADVLDVTVDYLLGRVPDDIQKMREEREFMSNITKQLREGKTSIGLLGNKGHQMSVPVKNKEEYDFLKSVLKTLRETIPQDVEKSKNIDNDQ